MILWYWYITNEQFGIACLTSTSVTIFHATREIRFSSIKSSMVSHGTFSARVCLKVNFVGSTKITEVRYRHWNPRLIDHDVWTHVSLCSAFNFNRGDMSFREPRVRDLSSSSYSKTGRYWTSKSIFVERQADIKTYKSFKNIYNIFNLNIEFC